MHSDHQSHMPRTRCGTAQQGPAVPGGLGITSWTSSSAARLSLIHQMLFLLLSSPVGLNFPPPGALWSGQGLERPGGGGRVSFKITQGVDSSLAVVLWKGLACPNRSVLCPRPSAAGSSAVVEPAVGALVVDEPYGIRKTKGAQQTHPSLAGFQIARLPLDLLPSLGELRMDEVTSGGLFPPELSCRSSCSVICALCTLRAPR